MRAESPDTAPASSRDAVNRCGSETGVIDSDTPVAQDRHADSAAPNTPDRTAGAYDTQSATRTNVASDSGTSDETRSFEGISTASGDETRSAVDSMVETRRCHYPALDVSELSPRSQEIVLAYDERAEARASIVNDIYNSWEHILCETSLERKIFKAFPDEEYTSIAEVVSDACVDLDVTSFYIEPNPITREDVQIIIENRDYLCALDTVPDNYSSKLSEVAKGIPARSDADSDSMSETASQNLEKGIPEISDADSASDSVSVADTARHNLDMSTLQATNNSMQDFVSAITNLTNNYPDAPIEFPEILSTLTQLASDLAHAIS